MKKNVFFFAALLVAMMCFNTANATVPAPTGWWTFDDTSDLLKQSIQSSPASIESFKEQSGDKKVPQSASLSVAGIVASDGPIAGSGAVTIAKDAALKFLHGSSAAVDAYTLMYDVKMPMLTTYTCFLQNDKANATDGGIFRKNATIGYSGYSGSVFTANTWYRIILVVDKTSANKRTLFVNGTQVHQENVGARHTLAADYAWLFCDDSHEDETVHVSGLAYWTTPLTAAESSELGNTTTAAITSNQKSITVSISDASIIDGALVSGANTVNYGSTHTFKLTPTVGYAVTGVDYEGNPLIPNLLGVYTIPYVTADGALTVTTEEAPNTVTVNKGAGIASITLPVLDAGNQFPAATTAAIFFTLAPGYENPSASITGATQDGSITENEGVYTLTLSNVTNGADVTISATLINYAINKVETNATVVFDKSVIHYNDVVTGTVSVSGLYHSPYVSMGGVYKALDTNNQFTFTVTSDTAVSVTAFEANVLPVTEDTYVDGGSDASIYNGAIAINFDGLTSSNNVRRAYLRFQVPASFKTTYNKAVLKFRLTGGNNSPANKIMLRTVPSNVAAIASYALLNFTGSGETKQASAYTGIELAQTTGTYNNGSAGKIVELDASAILTNSAFSTEQVDLQLATTEARSGNYTTLYANALENGNAAYVPQLVFEKTTPTGLPEVTIDDNAPVRYYNLQGIEVSAPVKGNIYIVKQGAKAWKTLAK